MKRIAVLAVVICLVPPALAQREVRLTTEQYSDLAGDLKKNAGLYGRRLLEEPDLRKKEKESLTAFVPANSERGFGVFCYEARGIVQKTVGKEGFTLAEHSVEYAQFEARIRIWNEDDNTGVVFDESSRRWPKYFTFISPLDEIKLTQDESGRLPPYLFGIEKPKAVMPYPKSVTIFPFPEQRILILTSRFPTPEADQPHKDGDTYPAYQFSQLTCQ